MYVTTNDKDRFTRYGRNKANYEQKYNDNSVIIRKAQGVCKLWFDFHTKTFVYLSAQYFDGFTLGFGNGPKISYYLFFPAGYYYRSKYPLTSHFFLDDDDYD